MSYKQELGISLKDLSGMLTQELSETIALFAINKNMNSELSLIFEEFLKEHNYIDAQNGTLQIQECSRWVSISLDKVTHRISDKYFGTLIKANEYLVPKLHKDRFTIFFSGSNLKERKQSMAEDLMDFVHCLPDIKQNDKETMDELLKEFLKRTTPNKFNYMDKVIISTKDHHISTNKGSLTYNLSAPKM